MQDNLNTRAVRPGDTESIATLRVDVIADLICPWCYIGKRRLDEALRAVHGPSAVHWYPFQLNPSMPADGMPLEAYLASRFGDPEVVRPGLEQLRETGRAEGIDFRFERLERVPNTLDAHRLMYLAETRGLDTSALADSLYRRFFTVGEDISDIRVLESAGVENGLRAADVHAALEDDGSRQIVLNQETQMKKSGVAGAPAYLVNQRLFVSGAQETELLVSLFDRAMFGADSDSPVSQILH